MERLLPTPELLNDTGACWTCLKKNRVCDLALPHCKNCTDRGLRCRGFGYQLRWPDNLAVPERKPKTGDRTSAREPSRGSPPTRAASVARRNFLPYAISMLGLPAETSFYMQHYLHNIARIALAIDYTGNGYRALLPMAMQESVVMNATMAVATSHHSRWQQTSDTLSRKYLRATAKALRERFKDPDLLRSQVTLAVMLLLVSFEVFSGSSRWQGHYDAIRGWIRSQEDFSRLDPFLKTWVCLIDTQRALNLGLPAAPELENWMDTSVETGDGQADFIDALFGCSARLPKLMCLASKLFQASKDPSASRDNIRCQANVLQEKIRATKIGATSDPAVGVLCQGTGQTYPAIVGLDDEELRRRMVATAEIFRHASHIYVYRIAHGPEEPLNEEMQASVTAALELLTLVPDTLGPGANLGWCLVVIGAELDIDEQRVYIRSRWAGLNLLGIQNAKSGQNVLEEVWHNRDLVMQAKAQPERWQDIMQRLGESQILV